MVDHMWSRRGAAPTEFERGLVERVDADTLPDSMQRMVQFARMIGMPAFVQMLDWFDKELVWIPGRASFFAALWRPLRDDAIRRAHQQGFTPEQIAEQFGVTKRRIQQVLREAGKKTFR